MFSEKVSVAKNWMVVGKLLILAVISMPVYAEVDDPKFFSFTGSTWTNRLVEMTFGWFKTLDDEQKLSYNQAITQALEYADNGQVVRWYKNDASGMAMVSASAQRDVATLCWNRTRQCAKLKVD